MSFGVFPSFTNLTSFLFAKEFRSAENPEQKVETNVIDKFMGRVIRPVTLPIEGVLKNYDKSIMIIVSAGVALVGWTLLHYPQELEHGVQYFVPEFNMSWIRCVSFTVSQMTIMGLALRSLARLNDQNLVTKWLNHQVLPYHFGTRELRP